MGRRQKTNLNGITHELRRYGLRSHDVKLWVIWLALGLSSALLLPSGQSNNIFHFMALHVAFLGFGATVFGFTILGGKDDFFEPIMESNDDGLDTLRNMVLHLFWPLVLHAIASLLLLVRIALPDIGTYYTIAMLWRILYAVSAIWGFAQSATSVRFLFILANVRLIWKDKQVRTRKSSKIFCITCRQPIGTIRQAEHPPTPPPP